MQEAGASMAVLQEGFYELDGYVFGGTDPNGLWVEEYEIEEPPLQDVQVVNPVNGKVSFGRESFSGPLWKFELAMMTGDITTGLAKIEAALGKWRNEERLGLPETESVLRYTRGGRTRRVYGRPRKFRYDTDGFLRQGSSKGEATFQASDMYFYDDAEKSMRTYIVKPSTGGVVLPQAFPWQTIPSEERIGVIDSVGGTAYAPMRIVVNGPISNPVVSGDGWTVKLEVDLAYDQTATIDTRAKTVLRSDGASLAGFLTRDSILANARLRPGQDEIRFSGSDATGTAFVTVYWRPTYRGL